MVNNKTIHNNENGKWESKQILNEIKKLKGRIDFYPFR